MVRSVQHLQAEACFLVRLDMSGHKHPQARPRFANHAERIASKNRSSDQDIDEILKDLREQNRLPGITEQKQSRQLRKYRQLREASAEAKNFGDAIRSEAGVLPLGNPTSAHHQTNGINSPTSISSGLASPATFVTGTSS